MIRKATLEDLDQVMECIEDSREYLKKQNIVQWNEKDGYPNRNTLYDDIINGDCYVNIKDGVIAGCCSYAAYEPEYENIYGNWLTEEDNYITIHRLSTRLGYRGIGVAKELMKYGETYAKKLGKKSIKIDTHPLNMTVQHIALSLGYTLCGYVFYTRIKVEAKRLIFEKIIK